MARHGIGRGGEPAVIRSGVRLSDYPASGDAAALRATVGVGPHKLLVVSIGNLKPQQTAADFVRAAAKVLEKVPNARFVFLAPPSWEELQDILDTSDRFESLEERAEYIYLRDW